MRAELKRAALDFLRRLGIDPHRLIPEILSQEALEAGLKAHVEAVAQAAVQKAVMSIFKPWRPDSTTAFRLERKGRLDKGEVERILEEEGRTPYWVERAWNLMEADPSLENLLSITEGVEPSKEFLVQELKHNLFLDRDAELLCELLRSRAVRDFRAQYLEVLEGLVEEGALDPAEAVAGLDPARLGEVQRRLLEEWLKRREHLLMVKLRKMVEQERLRWNLIAPEDYVNKLVSIGVRKEVAVVEAELIMARRGTIWEPEG